MFVKVKFSLVGGGGGAGFPIYYMYNNFGETERISNISCNQTGSYNLIKGIPPLSSPVKMIWWEVKVKILWLFEFY